jgi:PAS domain S-box-containing protein
MAEAIDLDPPRGAGPEVLVSSSASPSAAALLVVDEDRHVLEVNRAACELLGAMPAELVGERLDALIAPGMRQRLDQVWQAFREHGGHAGPFELVGGTSAEGRVDIGVTSGVIVGHHLVLLSGTTRAAQGQADDGARADGRRPPTSREREVLSLLASGDTDGQIARKLSLSPATVQTHVRNAKGKLGARTRAQAVALALRRGMISVGF